MNNKMVHRLLVVSALSFTGLTSGCGKSKETKAAAPPTAGELGQPAPSSGRQTGRAPGTGAGTKAPVPVAPPAVSQPPVKRPPVKPPTQPPTNPPPTSTVIPQTPPNLPNSNERVNFDGTAVKTGGIKAAAGKSVELFYTGTSNDQLLETLLVSLNSKTDGQRSVDYQIARDIKFVKLAIERSSGKRILTINTDEENAKAQLFQLIESEQNPNLLIPRIAMFPTQNGILKAVSAELTCMDKTPAKNSLGRDQCLVTVANVQFANGQAQIIFRKNHALVDAEFDMTREDFNSKQNTGLELWKDYISSRVDQVITFQKVDEVIVSSYEVVGGKSEMGILLTAEDGSSAGFRVPLLAQLQGSSVNAAAYVNNHIDHRFDFSDYAKAKKYRDFTLGNAVESVRLVKNNGRGDVMLSITFDKLARRQNPKDQSRLNLIISRNQQVIDLEKLSQTVK